MPQLWGNERLFLSCCAKKLRAALQPQSSIGWMSGKVPRGIATPSVYSFLYSSPRYFSPLLLSAPFPDIRGVGSLTCLPYLDAGVDVVGAGAVVLGAGAGVVGAGAGFTAALLGDDVVGAAEL